MEELNKKYLEASIIKTKYRKVLEDYLKDAFIKYGDRFEINPVDYKTWDDAVEHEGSFITNQIPFSVTCQDYNGEMFEVYITSLYLFQTGKGAYITGYNFDSYGQGYIEGQECYFSLENIKAIVDFINLSLGNQYGWIKVGVKCKWIDPGINDYDAEDREIMLNREFEIVSIEGEVISIECEDAFAEVYAHELEPID